ncbi:PREDICTED: uncharacterized protein LOC104749709 [Camelina sativa]|uniref:Uncharacterized protein LOC104749709 n=1 Tax=Camelina sativa TaxID=90675 RepID=A0ABM0WDX6_CAMSA|nr:PREDICTED: uncharacterized protein LOC104749709 [Camelina sativa]
MGPFLRESRVAVLDTWFTHMISIDYVHYKKSKKKSTFQWNSLIKNYVRGSVYSRQCNLTWFSDVDTVYIPMNWGKRHWVALAIKLKEGVIEILDPLIANHDESKLPHLMKPLVEMLPIIINDLVNPKVTNCPLPESFKFDRLVDVYQNDRNRDCGPLNVKYIKLPAQGLGLDTLTEKMVDDIKMAYAVDVYQEFVVQL